jgi:NTP pyrophosphatase (non-canonical NTP hydrolase)
MNLNEYQKAARATAVYPDEWKIVYPALGLAGEAGEAVEKIKKAIRKSKGYAFKNELDYAGLIKELGDVMWYVANLCTDLGIELELVGQTNLEKLASRADRDVLKGEGDNR